MKDIAGLLDKGMMTTKWKSASCDFEVSKQEGIQVLCQFSIMLPEIQLVGYEE